MISLIVFRNNCFSCESELSTKAKTLCRKKSGFPIEMLPRAIEAAVLTSSLCDLNRAEIVSIKLLTYDKSVSLPNSPRQRAPLSY